LLPGDSGRLLEIFNAAIRSGIANTENSEKDQGFMNAWIESHDERYSIVVVESQSIVVGYASLNRYFPERSAYRGVADVSYYVDPGWQGRGVGTLVMRELLKTARRNGFHKVVARTFFANHSSRGLLRKLGFREIGLYFADA